MRFRSILCTSCYYGRNRNELLPSDGILQMTEMILERCRDIEEAKRKVREGNLYHGQKRFMVQIFLCEKESYGKWDAE